MGKFLQHIFEASKEKTENKEISSTDSHEIMVACFCVMDNNEFEKNDPNGKESADLDVILDNLYNIAAVKEKNKIIGKNEKEIAAIITFKDKYDALAQAYSAAKEIRKKFDDKASFVILTGRKWHSDVQQFSGIENLKKFGINSYGMKDFNSSDIILTNKSDIVEEATTTNKFLGISLKKKESAEKAADPTMLNRSVEGALGINEEVKTEIEIAFNDFFNTIIKDNIDKFIPNNNTLDAMFEKLYLKSQKTSNIPYKTAKTAEEVKEWFKDKCSKLNDNDWKMILSSKYGLMAEHPSKDNVRNIINNALKRKGSVFEKLQKVILENADELAFALIQIIYKGDLSKLIANQFDFALCIGKGSYIKKKCVVKDAEYESIALIENAIDKLRSSSGKPNIAISSKQNAFDENNTAAKLFFDLRIGNHTIANIEVRYKGSYTSSPQFFATMSNQFKEFLKNGEW